MASVISGVFVLLGLVLLGVGLYGAYWLFGVVQDFLYSPDKIVLMDRVLQLGSALNLPDMKTPIDNVSLNFHNILKYVLFIFICMILLSAIGRVVGILISSGIRCLSEARGRKAD